MKTMIAYIQMLWTSSLCSLNGVIPVDFPRFKFIAEENRQGKSLHSPEYLRRKWEKRKTIFVKK